MNERQKTEKIKRLEKVLKLAVKAVEKYRYADTENDKWRERHEHWKELDKIITDKEHLKVEAIYDKASGMMDGVIKLWKKENRYSTTKKE